MPYQVDGTIGKKRLEALKRGALPGFFRLLASGGIVEREYEGRFNGRSLAAQNTGRFLISGEKTERKCGLTPKANRRRLSASNFLPSYH